MKFSLNKYLEVPTSRSSKSSNCLYGNSFLKKAKHLTLICCCLVNKLKLPKQFEWTTDDVLDWIENLGFPQYKESFRVNYIDGRKLIQINASALIKMNIKNFDHIKIITKSIREMYGIEDDNFKRSISLPFHEPINLYKLHKSKSGFSYEKIRCCDYLKKVNLLNDIPKELNHFEALHNWFKHIPDFHNIRIGMIKRESLYHVKRSIESDDDFSLESLDSCACEIPPCDCKWTDEELNDALKITLLIGK